MTAKRYFVTGYSVWDSYNNDRRVDTRSKPICDLLNQLNDENVKLLKENEQLKQQLSDIEGQLVMLDNCDNWDYDRMKYTVREIAEIIDYNGTINPKR